jgi:hypothetical protein
MWIGLSWLKIRSTENDNVVPTRLTEGGEYIKQFNAFTVSIKILHRWAGRIKCLYKDTKSDSKICDLRI